MFEMSVKSVPGCLTLIAPSMIGVPVAATPGLGPHDEVALALWATARGVLALLLALSTDASAITLASAAIAAVSLTGVP